MKRHSQSAGFTLLEIMIVVLIISIAVGFAALMSSHILQSRRISGFAKRLAIMLPAIEQQAVLQSNPIGMSIGSDYIRFYQYDPNRNSEKMTTPNSKEKSNWVRVTHDQLMHSLSIPKNIRLRLHLQAKEVTSKQPATPMIVFDANGESTPFTLEIGDSNRYNYRLTGGANGVFTLNEIK